jgi:hypothetical protein
VSFKISDLYPPLREFMRMPEGTQVLYAVESNFPAAKNIIYCVVRAQGDVLIEPMMAVPANGDLSENLLKCTVLKSAPPANKSGPKTPTN